MELSLPTAMDAWKAALSHILDYGENFTDDDGRTCREVLNLSVTIKHPDVGLDDPIDRIRKNERWVYPPKDELIGIIFNQWDLPLYDYTYGSRIFGYQEVFDQINEYVIPLLRKNSTSRRAFALTVDPLKDLHLTNRNVPGLISLHFKVKEGKLLLTSVIRSNDFFIGWPANAYQLGSLQKYIADELELGVGALATYSISAHVFEEQLEDIHEVLQR
ncbi:hypothetical protein JXA12_04335 [Candidatus Woesearchaeota archaeon]|nr:hypothetical protein [Candidatus Woesearchaeota archaeon]